MTPDLRDKEEDASTDRNDPAKSYYDDEFSRLTDPKHLNKDANDPQDSDDEAEGEGGEDDGSDSSMDGHGLARTGAGKGRDRSTTGETGGSGDDSGESESGQGGLYNPSDGRGRTSRSRRRRSKTGSRRKLIFAGTGLGALFLVLLIMMVLLAALKIPNFVEHVTAYEFTRVTRQLSRNTERITTENLAINSADEPTYRAIKARFSNAGDKTKLLYEKLANKYSPNRIINNYNTSGMFKPIYDSPTLTRGPQLKAIQLGDRTLLVKPVTGVQRFVPGIQFYQNVKISQEVAPYMKASLKADEIGHWVRGKVYKGIRARYGMSAIAWKVGQWTGNESEAEAKVKLAREMNQAIKETPAEGAKTALIQEAVDEGKQILEKDLQDPKELEKIIDNGGVDEKAYSAVLKKLATNGVVQDVTKVVSPSFAIGMPICIVYDGSIQSNGGTVDASSTAKMRTFSYVAAASDQVKDGTNADAKPAGQLSDRLGPIEQSPAERRASGEIVNVSDQNGSHTPPGGDYRYTIMDFLTAGHGSIPNAFFDSVCPYLTNPYLALGAGGLNILACFTPVAGQAACTAEKFAAEGAKSFTARLAEKVLTKVFSAKAGYNARASIGFLKVTGKDFLKTSAKIAGATVAAYLVTLNHMGSDTNGLQSDYDLQADVESGGNLTAQVNMQQGLYGRPLTDTEIAQNSALDRQATADKIKTESIFERYASISNPDSLISHVALSVNGLTGKSIFNSFFKTTAQIFNPMSIFASTSRLLTPHSYADDTISSVNTYYGNVQWGYATHESSLIDRDPSYNPLENQEILDQSGKDDAITEKYGKCFDGNTQIGEMLAKGWIQRTETGDIISTDGDCAPSKLSDSNDEFGPQMIFRWRVAHGYSAAVDQLTDEQDVAN